MLDLPEKPALLLGMEEVVGYVKSLEAGLARHKRDSRTLEIIVTALARRNDGKLTWTADEITEAKAERRMMFIGGRELTLEHTSDTLAQG